MRSQAILSILIALFALLSMASAFSTLDTKDAELVKGHLQGDNWNIYALYFFDSYNNKDDAVLRQNLQNNVLNTYGDNVYFGKVDVSSSEHREVLDLVNFDTERQAMIDGSVREKDVSNS